MSVDTLPTGERTHELLTVRARPRPASALSAVTTLAWRALLKIKHVPFQLFDVTLILAYTLAFLLVAQLIEWVVMQPLENWAMRWRT